MSFFRKAFGNSLDPINDINSRHESIQRQYGHSFSPQNDPNKIVDLHSFHLKLPCREIKEVNKK